MTTLNRRALLRLIASAPMAAGFVWTEAEAAQAHHQAQAARTAARRTGTAFKPKFFTAHEYATVVVLVDLIIPKDERSGSATDAGVPEFMDFIMLDQPTRQTAMRGGLAWLDLECQKRFDKRFLACADADRRAVLDDLSGVEPVASGVGSGLSRTLQASQQTSQLSHGIAFFRSFRDLTASGFWTSKMGIADLQYIGNTFVAEWKGCPEEALQKLGIAELPDGRLPD